MATVSDRKLSKDNDADALVDYYKADVLTASDYYPFGMQMPGRHWTADSSDKYRFGFQGQLKENDLYGDGNSYAFKYRINDARLGRFLSLDPKAKEYPWNSPYAFSENRLIDGIELEDAEFFSPNAYKKNISPTAVMEEKIIREVKGIRSDKPLNVTKIVTNQAVKQFAKRAIGQTAKKGAGLFLNLMFMSKPLNKNENLDNSLSIPKNNGGNFNDQSQSNTSTNNGNNNTYTIEKGDTFWDLEEEKNIEHGKLQEKNPEKDPRNLKPGDKIKSPGNNSKDKSRKEENKNTS